MERSTCKRWILCLVLVTVQQISSAEDLPLLMPNVRPQENDLYLCVDKKIDDDFLYITGFQPNASMSVAHHILIYGCSEPGMVGGKPWNCGEMHSSSGGDFKSGPVCKDSGRIIYAWAMDAPDLQLPKDVAFKIGAATAMKYLVIQVHYKDASSFLPPSVKTDNSGVILKTTSKARDKTAGVYLIAVNGKISPHSVTYMEAACTFQEPLIIRPFAYRVHTHKLGKVVSGYRLRNEKWNEIGRRNPQLPQMFYPVNDTSLTIEQGDVLAARCTMENEGSKTVEIGPTSDDEMCNFYIMYYTSGDQDIQDPICTSPGPPNWRWSDFVNPNTIPFQASVDPVTNNWFKEYQKTFDDIRASMQETQLKLAENFQNFWRNSPFKSNYDYPSPNVPPMNYYNYPSENQYDDYAYEYRDPDTKKNQNTGNLLASLNLPLGKATVVSSKNTKSQAKYKYVNGQFVKVEETPQEPQPPAESPPPGAQGTPGNWESFESFNDNNGGTGTKHTKQTNVNHEFNIPGGKGYIKSSSSSSSSHTSYSKSSSF